MEFLEALKKITNKEVYELTDNDIAFLRARRDYLTKEEAEKFSDVLSMAKETSDKEVIKKRSKKKLIPNP